MVFKSYFTRMSKEQGEKEKGEDKRESTDASDLNIGPRDRGVSPTWMIPTAVESPALHPLTALAMSAGETSGHGECGRRWMRFYDWCCRQTRVYIRPPRSRSLYPPRTPLLHMLPNSCPICSLVILVEAPPETMSGSRSCSTTTRLSRSAMYLEVSVRNAR